MCAVDGAGLTTYAKYDFTVNCVGPVTEWIRIDNASSPYEITPWDTLPGTAQVGERRLITSFYVKDEVPLTTVKYSIFPSHAAAPPDGTALPISYFNSHQENSLVLVADSFGSEFQSAPVSYTLQVWGESAGPLGIKLSAKIEFEFLMSLAIVAPHFEAADDGGAMWIGKDEQTKVARYLFDSITAVENKVVYDMSGNAVLQDGYGDLASAPDLGTWLSAQTATGTTDALVVIDQAQEDLVTGDAFKHFYQDGTDGDAIVWMGHYPFSTYMKPDGSQGYRDGLPNETAFQNLLACGVSPDYGVSIYDEADEGVFQETYPDPGTAPSGNIYIPSLNDHAVDDFTLTHVLRSATKKTEGENWGNSTLERAFTVNSSFVPNQEDSANFVTRHNSSKGRFANFFSYGAGTGGGTVTIPVMSGNNPGDTSGSNVLDTSPWDHVFTLSVTEQILIEDMTIYLNIDGVDWEDYDIWLEGPNGMNASPGPRIFDQDCPNGKDEHIDNTFPTDFPLNIEDWSWTGFHSGDALDQFTGTLSKGEWKLHIEQNSTSASGTVKKWGLNIIGKSLTETTIQYGPGPAITGDATVFHTSLGRWESVINVPDGGYVTNVRVKCDFQPSDANTFVVYLVGPNGENDDTDRVYESGGSECERDSSASQKVLYYCGNPDNDGATTFSSGDWVDKNYSGTGYNWGPDSDAFLPFEGISASGDWKLVVEENAQSPDDSAVFNDWYLELTIGVPGSSTIREPVGPAPYVIREFIENFMLNKGHPDAAAKGIFYSADKTHQGYADPSAP